ncbi:MAG TPA: 50S ribosomal protein L9 [Casimicrobiaceae bacterium]
MQIILMEKVANVGGLGEVVKVKDGYARNFLIPQGKARRATPDNLKLLEGKRAELEKAAADKLAAATAQSERLAGTTLRVTQKAGVDGRLFGSVTNIDVVEALKAQGFAVEKAQIRMPAGPLKQVGDHTVGVALHTDVVTDIVVHVVGDTSQG